MDPGRSTQVLTVNYFVNLYDTLTRWDTSLKLEPGLATSWKNVNELDLGFHAAVRREVPRRHPVTAQDVKATSSAT
jgi:ABC-type transport system substrate-binding protein